MPYVDAEARERLELGFSPQTPGELNYKITLMVDDCLGPTPTYADINSVIGVLECCKLEIYRRIAIPYENGKIKSNGDVFRKRSYP